MPVNPELLALLDAMPARPPLNQVPLETLRGGGFPFPLDPGASMAKVVDMRLATPNGELPVRIYQPRHAASLPVLVYFHGGGFALGSIDSHDAIVRNLALSADCVVVSVAYRLAPEHRFPAAVDDCLAATRWVHSHAKEIEADVTRLAVGGDSAGGNLAAVVALRLRDEGDAMVTAQLLIYPMTHLGAPVQGTMVVNGEGYFLSARDVAWFEASYLGDSGAQGHAHASPMLAPSLHGLPPALVITAEFDPLRDQGEQYALRLREAGAAITLSRYDGAIHGFFGMAVDIGRRAVAEAGDWLRTVLSRSAVRLWSQHVRGSKG